MTYKYRHLVTNEPLANTYRKEPKLGLLTLVCPVPSAVPNLRKWKCPLLGRFINSSFNAQLNILTGTL